jgi:hypothetical protein
LHAKLVGGTGLWVVPEVDEPKWDSIVATLETLIRMSDYDLKHSGVERR